MAEMKARIVLDSNGYTSGANKVVSDTDNMINATKKAKEKIDQLGTTKIQPNVGADKVINDTDNMVTATKKVKETMEQLGTTKIQPKIGMDIVVKDSENMITAAKKVKESIDQIGETKVQPKIGADTNEAEKKVSKMRETINSIKGDASFLIEAKDMASSSISRIKSNVTSLVKSNFKFEIAALDKTKSVINGIKDSIFNLKTLAAGIVLGAGAKKGFDLTLGNAMSNEQYLSTLQTVLHGDKAGSEALKWSYKQAAATPFDANQVVSGVTQLATSGLDFKKYLMPLGDAAAAMNKPLEQAIFAMAKLKSGQYGEGVNQFRDLGISNEDWKKQGAVFSKNGELQMDNPQKAVDMVTKIMQEKYGGLMDRQSGTAKGMISNIGDTINGMGRGLAGIDSEGAIMKGGLFDNFKKQLTVIMPLLNKIQSSNTFAAMQKEIGKLATEGGQKLTTFLKSFDDPKKVKEYGKSIKEFFTDMQKGWQLVKEFSKALLEIGKALEPLIKTVAAHPKLFVSLFAGFEVGKGIFTLVGVFRTIRAEIPLLKAAVSGFVTFFTSTPLGLTIAAITVTLAILYEAWIHDWGGIQEKTAAVCKSMKEEWEAIKKAWENLKTFFKDPIKATVKSVNEGIAVTVPKGTKQNGSSGPQGLARDSGNVKYNALGTSYFSGGETWVGENGPEKLTLPGGSKILSNRESINMTSKSKEPNLTTDFSKQGENIPLDLAKGVKKTTQQAIDSVNLMAASTVKGFGTSTTANSKYAIEPVDNLSTNIQCVFTILANNSNPLGKQVVGELGQGVQDSSGNLTEIVKTLTDKVITTFKEGFGIHSPSKVTHEMGGHLIQGLMNGMTSKDMNGFVQNWISSITGTMGGAVNGSLSGWIGAAMALTGVSNDWFGPLMSLIQHESGGDPNSINLWDSNAAAGHPSKGLMQLIDENMSDHHLPGMDNIYDPISNIAAGIRLIQHDYGSIFNTPGIKALSNGGSYVGYANGGIANQASIFGEGQYAEAAIPLKKNSSRSQQLLDIADNYVNGDKKDSKSKDLSLVINFNGMTIGEEEFFDKAGTHIVNKVKLAIKNM